MSPGLQWRKLPSVSAEQGKGQTLVQFKALLHLAQPARLKLHFQALRTGILLEGWMGQHTALPLHNSSEPPSPALMNKVLSVLIISLSRERWSPCCSTACIQTPSTGRKARVRGRFWFTLTDFLTALEFAQPWDHRDQVMREYLQGWGGGKPALSKS